jgi:hypothetical protein
MRRLHCSTDGIEAIKLKCSSTPLDQSFPQTKMIPDDFWPVLFLVSTSTCIGVLACLLITVFSIIFERRAAEEETRNRRTAENDSPAESYRTFERSFDGSLDDYAPASGQRRASITPRKSSKQQRDMNLHTTTTRRDFRSNQSGI